MNCDYMDAKIGLWIEEIRKYNPRLHLASPALMNEIGVHVEDCMNLISAVREETLADLGSGSGLPAIPFKIAHPGTKVYLLERSSNRSEFLRHVIDLLKLENIEVIDGEPLIKVGAVMSRAFSPKKELEKILKKILLPGGRLYYMATIQPELSDSYRLEKVIEGTTTGIKLFIFEPAA